MIRHLSKLSLIAYLALILIGCESDPIAPIVEGRDTTIITQDTRALYVLNEGQFGKSNATLDVMLVNSITTIIDSINRKDTIITFDTIYQKDRIAALGDVGNDVKLISGKLYIVLNGSHQIVVVDPNNATETARIDFPVGSSSNKIAYVGENKAFVTQLKGGSISVVDLTTNTIVASHPYALTNDIGVLNNKVFVTADSQTLAIINPGTGTPDNIVAMPFGPQQLVVDSAHNQIIVACQGNYADPSSNSHLVWLNATTGEIIKTEQVGVGSYAIGRLFLGNGKLYMLSGTSVKTIDLTTRTISGTPFISSSTFYYGGSIDPVSGNLYLGDAGSFSAAGKVDVYSGTTGQFLKSFGSGIAPAHFAFYR